jgi:hypothetical protein
VHHRPLAGIVEERVDGAAGAGRQTWKRTPAGITPSSRSDRNVSYEAMASSMRGHVSQCSSCTPGLTAKIGVSYACRGKPVGESVSCTTSMPGFGRTSRSRS